MPAPAKQDLVIGSIPQENCVNSSSLKDRTIKAIGWVVVGYGLSQILRLISTFVTTRLLAPEAFGVMAIATMVTIIVGLLSDLGLHQSVVRSNRGDDPVFLDTVWTLQAARGLIIWMASILVALGLLASNSLGWIPSTSAYSDKTLPLIISSAAFAAVISGFRFTKASTATRSFDQKSLIRIEILSQIVAMIVTLSFAAILRSVWALVIGSLAGALSNIALTHWILPGRPNRLRWDREAVLEIVIFGKWIFASSAVGVFALSADRLVFGALMDAGMLGQYTIAALLVAAVQGIFSKVYAAVVMPALSEVVRLAPSRLNTTFAKVRFPSDLLLMLAAGLLSSLGAPVVRLLYDSRYGDAGWILEILAASLIWLRYDVSIQLYLSLGLSRNVAIINAARLLSAICFMLCGYFLFSIRGAVWGFALHQLSSAILVHYFNSKIGIKPLSREWVVLSAFPFAYLLGIAISAALSRSTF